ncbi:hypothetical protein B0H67DRAFT_648563 [Lasiosphaeris hirsuta]|uniref:ubiquitinyl hydrolase 1 n=1 Tax=Lasiosphaeris hirsuta TaxID=260670 RepID=A0AA40A3D9_9PEZI|nr:hypothetical protein B0H67DRAFT_648563 [Lasiosphaeris hirsuta]
MSEADSTKGFPGGSKHLVFGLNNPHTAGLKDLANGLYTSSVLEEQQNSSRWPRLVVDAKPPIRVITDVGAQITGLDNAEVARRWLDLVPRAKASAAVFFDSDESMCVVTRDGIKEPFLTSPYVANTAPCLVFLDEAHARGTDIRLPGRSRAAVTLGPMLAKDWLVQARPWPSVVFLVPAEVRERITVLCRIRQGGKIRVADVLAWSIDEMWRDARRLVPLWAAQGLKHQRQQLLMDAADKGDRYEFSSETAAQFLESDGLTLRDRYRPAYDGQARQTLSREAARIQRRCRAFGPLAEREKPRPEPQPLPVRPLASSLHPHVEVFVRTGDILPGSEAFMLALHALVGSSVAHLLQDLQWPPDLLTTADFAGTVQFFLALFKRIRHPSADISTTDLRHILAGDVLLPPFAFSGPTRAR